MRHVLVVGGTGMLKDVSRHFARQGMLVSVVSRRPGVFDPPDGIHTVSVDYHDADRLAAQIRNAIAEHGPCALAICWIHSTAPAALRTVAAELARPGRPFRLFHVRGSAASDPARLPRPGLEEIPPQCAYRQVILGFVVDGTRSRWLTHAEIATGVIRSVETDLPESVVGVVRPWHLRP